jgi:hypothetical protein
MANSNGWGDGAGNNAIGWGQGANNNIGWGDSHTKSWAGLTDIVGIDADAQAFITAAAITDPVQINAINTLVEGMKTDGIWTKMKAIYPFVGGTASTHKYNLKDPRDLDAAFRLVFNGGWTHSSTGATPNGTNGYADTKLSTSVLTNNSTHISYYSRSATAGSTRSEIGGGDPATNVYLQMLSYRLTGNYNGDQYYGAATLNRIDVAVADSRGYFIDSRTNSSTHKAWKSNVLIGSESNLQINNISSFSQNIYIGGRNNGGSADLFSDRQSAFSTIGDGLTDTEASNLYTRVQAYQTALSRQV